MTDQSHFNRDVRGRAIAAAAREGLGGIGHPRISIEGDKFALIDAGGLEYMWGDTIDVIIIDANPNVSKRLFEQGYNPRDPAPPLCVSDNGIGPSVSSRQKQARTCAECQYNSWGSDTSRMTGKGTKACRDFKKMAVLVVGDETGLVYELDAPPNSLKNLKKYSDYVSGFNNPGGQPADLFDLVTRVFFVDGIRGTLDFKETAWIDGNQAAQIDQAWNTNVCDIVTGKLDVAADPQYFQPPTQYPRVTAAPQPQGQQPQPGPGWNIPGRADAPRVTHGPAGSVLHTPPQRDPDPLANQPQSAPQAPTGKPRGGARPGAGRRPKGAQQAALPAQGEIFQPGEATPAEQSRPTQGPSFGAATPSGGGPAGMPPMPGFLAKHNASQAGTAQSGGTTNGPDPGARGGFTQAPQPDADVNAALDTAFSLGAPRRG
jgi:hypothetical protein